MEVNINDVAQILTQPKVIENYLEEREKFSVKFCLNLFKIKNKSEIEYNTLAVIYEKPEYKFIKSYDYFIL